MTFDAIDIFEVLEPMLDDYRKLRYRALGERGRAGSSACASASRLSRYLTDVSLAYLAVQTAHSPSSPWMILSTSYSRKNEYASCSSRESPCAKCSRRLRDCHGGEVS